MNQQRTLLPPFLLRLAGRNALKHAMHILLVVALIAMLPSLVSQTVTLLTGSDPTALVEELNETLTKIQVDSGLEGEELTAELNRAMAEYEPKMEAFLNEKGPTVLITNGVTLLLGPMLLLPLLGACLGALRKQEISVGGAMSLLKVSHKALGVSLLSALKAAVWMLPGYAVMALGLVLVLVWQSGFGSFLLIAGFILAVVPGVMAVFRYMMAPWALADDPSIGVRAAIKRSCEIMQHRKMSLFSLRISYVWWMLLQVMVQSMLMGLFGTVVGYTLGMMLNLVLQAYIYCGEGAFYEVYANGRQGDDLLKMMKQFESQPDLTEGE